jgi:hypothetical protein
VTSPGTGGLPRRRPDQGPSQQTVPLAPGGSSVASLLAAGVLTAGDLEELGLATEAAQATQIAGQATTNSNTGSTAANTGTIATNQFTHTDGVITGVPLTHGFGTDASAASYTITAGSESFEFFNIARTGYYVAINISIPAAATIPFLGVNMIWQSAATGLDVAQEQWYVPASSTGAVNIWGKGPTKANSLVIGFKNFDPAQTMTVTFSLYETTHHIARDDWRSSAPSAVPAFTAPPSSDPFALVLLAAGLLSIPGTTTRTYLLPVYAGQASFTYTTSAALNNINLAAYDPSTSTNPFLYTAAPAAASLVNAAPVTLPRCATLLTLNNTAAGAVTVNLSVMALEYAS